MRLDSRNDPNGKVCGRFVKLHRCDYTEQGLKKKVDWETFLEISVGSEGGTRTGRQFGQRNNLLKPENSASVFHYTLHKR